MRRLTAVEARRVLLARQGLCDDPGRPATPAAVRALVRALGFVQVDSVRAVERAHHLTLGARLDGYRPEMLAALHERERAVFEQWTHDASIVPVDWYEHWKPRFRRFVGEARQRSWWRDRFGGEVRKAMREVLRRVRRDGPVGASTFPRPKGAASGWWEWSPHKAAMEVMWRSGRLAVTRRENFQKIYDLPERVHPREHARPAPSRGAHVEWACASALERLGCATPAELAEFWRAVPVRDAEQWAARAVRDGRAQAVEITGVDGSVMPGLAVPGLRIPEPPRGVRILNPFDPVVRDRDRLERLFGFRYRFEAYTPAAKRIHGYYVLPVLAGDRFAARVDARMDREAGELRVDGFWWEPGVRVTRELRGAMERALGGLATRLGAGRVSIAASGF